MEIKEISNLKFITTGNGKFYAGMTYAEAEEQGLAKRVLRTDFTDIDLDKNNKLSINEIIKKREKEIKGEYFGAGLIGFLGLCDFITISNSVKSKIFWLAVDLFIVIASILKAENLKKGNEDFEKIANSLKENGRMDLLV